MHRRTLFLASLALVLTASAQKQASTEAKPPAEEESLRFAVIGDSGTGDRPATETAARLAEAHHRFPFKFVLMLGDNLYGSERPQDFEKKFERPYKALLDAGVKFYAALGNHDEPTQAHYKLFNMGGKRYYTFRPQRNIRFFALDTNQLDPEQTEWLEKELQASGSEWKIAFFHHPLYSSGERHGPAIEMRKVLEPIFLKHGVNVVFSGHEHFYERIKPQHGVYYFTVGSSAKLRRNGIKKSEITAASNAQDRTFMLVEIAGDQLRFQTITRSGDLIDEGALGRPERPKSITELR
ncbi:MAG TPA: metallophosphoesterase [Bryobacteraceae bacterium]|nr:metallophosphoesterase [Bryobacteraceae bacterium]